MTKRFEDKDMGERVQDVVRDVYGTDNERSKKKVRQGLLILLFAAVLLVILLAIIF